MSRKLYTEISLTMSFNAHLPKRMRPINWKYRLVSGSQFSQHNGDESITVHWRIFVAFTAYKINQARLTLYIDLSNGPVNIGLSPHEIVFEIKPKEPIGCILSSSTDGMGNFKPTEHSQNNSLSKHTHNDHLDPKNHQLGTYRKETCAFCFPNRAKTQTDVYVGIHKQFKMQNSSTVD